MAPRLSLATLTALLLLLAPIAAAHSAAAQHDSKRFERVKRAATSSTVAVNSSLSGVCTPSECIQGVTSLAAGVTVTTPINGSSQSVQLLPGTYSPISSAASGNSSLLDLSTSSSLSASSGFNTSGKASSTLVIALEAGVVGYSSPLYEGSAAFVPMPTSASSIANSTTSFESLVLSDNVWAVLSVAGARVIAWDSIPDVSALSSSPSSLTLSAFQSSACSTPCASGGVCTVNGTCACSPGFTGSTCNACLADHFGPSCEACSAGCTNCNDGITGTGTCLDVDVIETAAECDCVNGVCASNSTSATCGCNAGWTTAANGTQCATCVSGYYQSSTGDCLACDPSCAECSSPSGTCLTCQSGLAPSTSDPTVCVTATTALTNGTFISCADRTFFDSTNQTCAACNPICETCFGPDSTQCLACRSPYGLLDGECVAYSSTTGVCDSAGVVQNASSSAVGSNAGWVFDNTKKECDALPAKCTAGAIDSFTSDSTRADLTCSACLAGYWLSEGECVSECPTGTVGLAGETSCATCDSSCAECSLHTGYCTSCSAPGDFILNGTCISSCGSAYFSSANATCEACHPDCATCDGSFDTCLTCPSDRPVLTSSGTCVETCSSIQYFDTALSSCSTCDASCATCSGGGSSACLSCSSTQVLQGGSCVPAECDAVVAGFGVCLASLVTVNATESTPAEPKGYTIPWWLILLIVAIVFAVVVGGLWWWRKREQKRRREHTRRFGDGLDKKEVQIRLQHLPEHIAHPAPPSILRSPTTSEIPLTPRRVPSRPAPPPNGVFVLGDPPTPSDPGSPQTAWSVSSAGASQSRYLRRPELDTVPVPRLSPAPPPRRLVVQGTGLSLVSGYSTTPSAFSATTSGTFAQKKEWGDRNPFKSQPARPGFI